MNKKNTTSESHTDKVKQTPEEKYFVVMLYKRIKTSLSARMNFFMIFSISLSSLLAGGLLVILYQTPIADKIKLNSFGIGLIVLGISYIFSMVASIVINQTMLHPIRDIIQATKEVADGNYDITVEHKKSVMSRPTEINTLTESFNYMTQELRNTEMFRNDFIHNFSHEFKTPIISIRGFARQLYQGNLTPEQKTEFAKIIMDESEHLSNMSSNVLLLSKLENQEIVSDKVTFSLDEQLRNCVLIFEEAWTNKNLELDLDLESVEYYQNEDLLSHVWINLIGNAIKFSRNDGTLTITCKKINDSIWVAVTDTGIGIEPEKQKHIFDKFYQGDSSHATSGNGLGLALVKRILTMMNGRISVKSKPGIGTTFSVTLPIENNDI